MPFGTRYGKTQLIEGDTQSWPISFIEKHTYTVSQLKCRINIMLVECDLHNGKSLFVPLAKLGFPINYEFGKKSIAITNGRCVRHRCKSDPHCIFIIFGGWTNRQDK